MSTPQKIGQKNCDLVKKYEEKQGRIVKKARQGLGYGLISKKGENIRKIVDYRVNVKISFAVEIVSGCN